MTLDPGLSTRDLAILEFEKDRYKYAGIKEQAIRDLFDLSATRYYQALDRIIHTDEALAAEPTLVKRLRRISKRNQQTRTVRRAG